MTFRERLKAILTAQTMGQVDRRFTAICYALPGVAGSTVSFLIGGAYIWAIMRLVAGRLEFRLPWEIAVCMAVFVAYAAVSTFTIVIHGFDRAASGAFLDVLPFLLTPLVAARLRNTPGNDLTISIAMGSAVGGIASGAIGTYQNLVGSTRLSWRAEGGTGNAGPFSAMCVLLAFFALGGLLTDNRRMKVLGIIGFVGGTVGFYMSGSRGLVPGVPLLLIIFFICLMRAYKIPRSYIAGGAALLTIAAIVATPIVFSRQIDRVMSEPIHDLDSPRANKSSIGKRLLMYRTSLQAFAEAPILGHGPQNRVAAAKKHMAPAERELIRFTHLHNMLLDEAVGGGLVGLSLLLAVFAAPVWAAFRTKPGPTGLRVRYMIMVLTGIYLVHGMTNLALWHDIMTLVFCYSIVAIICSGEYRMPDKVWLSRRDTR